MNTSPARCISFLMLFAAIIHVPFFLGALFGEQDTARLVIDAVIWLKTGVRSETLSEYRFYISPGYIWLAKEIVRLSEYAAIHPAIILNALNLLGAVVIIIPVFLLFSKLTNKQTAFAAVIVLSMMPVFWQAGFYGFPHLPS